MQFALTSSSARSLVLALGLWGCMQGAGSGAVVYSGVQDIAITTDFGGVYLDLESGAYGANPITGWDVNFFFGGIGEYNDANFQPVRVSTDPFSTILNLQENTLIDSASVFGSGVGGSGDVGSEHVGGASNQFAPGIQGIVGFKIVGTTPKYGWMRVMFSLDDPGGMIFDWAYDDSGAAIAAGALAPLGIPEPGRTVFILLGVMGVVLRRHRSRAQSAEFMPNSGRRISVLILLLVSGICTLNPRTVCALDISGDGLSDVFQHRYSLDEGPDALTRDTDGDGQSDAREFLFGTDPTDAKEVPQTKPMVRPDGVFTLHNAVPGVLYGLQASANMRTWSEAVAPTVALSSEVKLILPRKPGYGAQQFYRFFAPFAQPDGDDDDLDVIEEALLGTSDSDIDSDNDGMPDRWEAQYHLAPTLYDANDDPDLDGYTNIEEYLVGTDPTVPKNVAPIIAFVAPSPGAESSDGAPLTLVVTASDPDAGDAVTVTFFDRGIELGAGVLDGGQYRFLWSEPMAGERVLLARARDSHNSDSWAAVAVSVRQQASDAEAYGPVEGGIALGIPVNAEGLRSSPFVSKPTFAAAIGGITGNDLWFDEQPSWTPGAYQSGFFVHVRSGTRRGALLAISGNASSTVSVAAADGLSQGDLIAIIEAASLADLLPAEAVHETTEVFTVEPPQLPPTSGPSFHRDSNGNWLTDAGAVASVRIDPLACFRVIHAPGSPGTILPLSGDVLGGPLRIRIASHSDPQVIALGIATTQPLSLIESGLADASLVRMDSDWVDVRASDGGMQIWSYIHRFWQPATGTADGSAAVIRPGGALIIHQAPAMGDIEWIQPTGK